MGRVKTWGILLLLLNITLLLTIQPIRAEMESTSEEEPLIELRDFHNGTKQMTIDYMNGTVDSITETFTRKRATLQVCGDLVNQSLSTALNVSSEGAVPITETSYTNTTETVMAEQEVLLGFTWDILQERRDYSDSVFLVGYVIMGIDIDIQFGLRLPMNITLEYPEQMNVGENYTLYTTLFPVDNPDFQELLFKFGARVWAEANMFGIQLARVDTLEEFGGYIDKSKSFTTPLGSDVEPIFEDLLNINLFDLLTAVFPPLEPITELLSLVFVPYVTFEPAFGSEKVTARANAYGDGRVVGDNDLVWSAPEQRLSFVVNADDYASSTNHTKISITDFRYYFTNFELQVTLLFDLNDVFNGWPLYWSDPEFFIGVLNLSFLTEELYLGTHSDTSGIVDFRIYVDRLGPPEVIEPRDVGVLWASVFPQVVSVGQIVNITVAIRNLGNVTENVNVTVRIGTVHVEVQTITGLEPEEDCILFFHFDTSELSPNTYNVTVELSGVPYEIDITDNLFIAASIEVGLPEYTLTVVSVPSGVIFTVDGELQTTLWSKVYHEETSVTIEMPETYQGFTWSHWSEDGDTNRVKIITLPASTYTAVYVSLPVGGVSVSIHSRQSAPWMPSVLLIVSLVVASSIYRKLRRKRESYHNQYCDVMPLFRGKEEYPCFPMRTKL